MKMTVFTFALITSFYSFAAITPFSSGDLIKESDLSHNKTEIDNIKTTTETNINSMDSSITALNQEITNYNTIKQWQIYGTRTNNVVYDINWSANITEDGTYACRFVYNSNPPVGNGGFWDGVYTTIINHTTVGKDNSSYDLYHTKTAHAFNTKDIFMTYQNVLNGPGQVKVRITGETANGRLVANCKKIL